MTESIETIIIGGGQAGLSLSYFLGKAGREHVILEKASQAGDAWRNRRWDSFTLVTPNWTFKLPGAEYDGVAPDGFMTKQEIVDRFAHYEKQNRFPIQHHETALKVVPAEKSNRYEVITNKKKYTASNVVLANGFFQSIKTPAFAAKIYANILQIPSHYYKNPDILPPGAVLVVGSGQSGCQIAEELNQAGRKVYLSTGSAGRIPRRYRGKDMVDWLNRIGFFNRTIEVLPSPRDRLNGAPHTTGKDGGHDLNLHLLARNGVSLLGHIQDYHDGNLLFAPDLKENLKKADEFARIALQMVDEYILKNQLYTESEEVKDLQDGYQVPDMTLLDLNTLGITVIIWACGYSMENLVQLPVIDSYGFPITDHGVTQYPGLFFLGMPWMNKFKSGLLMGIAESAQHLAEVIDQ